MKASFLEEQSSFSSVTRPSFEEFSCKTVHLTPRIRHKWCKFGCVRPYLGLHATDINKTSSLAQFAHALEVP
jgi:hypothetical protein